MLLLDFDEKWTDPKNPSLLFYINIINGGNQVKLIVVLKSLLLTTIDLQKTVLVDITALVQCCCSTLCNLNLKMDAKGKKRRFLKVFFNQISLN